MFPSLFYVGFTLDFERESQSCDKILCIGIKAMEFYFDIFMKINNLLLRRLQRADNVDQTDNGHLILLCLTFAILHYARQANFTALSTEAIFRRFTNMLNTAMKGTHTVSERRVDNSTKAFCD